MPSTTLEGHTLTVDDEGFMTDPAQWDDDVARILARQIGIELTDAHWQVLRFLREDHAANGETPTLRRVGAGLGIRTGSLFAMFPGKPAKKMAYVAGLPKPRGCV